MDEMNFCPFCNAAQHKILLCKNNVFFCRDCNHFFRLEEFKLKCPKCSNDKFSKGDFPSASGEVVFQCRSCRKMFSASEFFSFNKLK
jgi:transposase-like protein